jgi:hypothetical protein
MFRKKESKIIWNAQFKTQKTEKAQKIKIDREKKEQVLVENSNKYG